MRTVAALLLITTVVFAQSADKKGCSADGSVVNWATGEPIPRARIGLSGGKDDSAVAQSDAMGKWILDQLPCGSVNIVAVRPGFIDGQATQRPLTLKANASVHDLKIQLVPQSYVIGRVLDDQGDPIQNAQVTVMSSRVINGARRFQEKASTHSNDLGEYRIAGLAPGKYIFCALSAGPAAGNLSVVSPRFFSEKCYPGLPDAGGASAMELTAGAEGKVDFVLTPLKPLHVRGVIAGGPAGVTRAVTMSRNPPGSGPPVALASFVGDNGTFDISKVTAGAYILTAVSVQQSGRYVARVPLEVGDADIDGVHLHLDPPLTVTGTVHLDSAIGRTIDKPRYIATLRGADAIAGGTQTVWSQDMTSFTINDVLPGNYRLGFVAPPPFYLKSATLGGEDIADSEVSISPGANIDVVLSDDAGKLEGDVSTDDGPAPASVLVIRRGEPLRNLRTNASGHFIATLLPPGDYDACAWDDATNVEYANADWMRANAKCVSAIIQPGQTTQVKLTRQTAPPD